MKKTHKTPKMKNYLISKCIIGNGIINGAINAGIFYLLNLKHEGAFFSSSLYVDYAVTTFILTLCMALIVYPTLKSAVKKGKAPAMSCNGFNHSIGRVLPNNKWVLLTVVTVAMTLSVPAFFIGIASGIGFVPMNLLGAVVLKGIVCAVAGGLSTYLFTVARLFTTTTCVIPTKENHTVAA